jgi:hypothetical protein
MEMTYYTGIDVSLRSVSICGVDDRGEVCLETKVEAEIDAIVEHLRRFSSEVKSAAIAARSAALPSIPKELIDLFVTGPMSGDAVNAASLAFKKALIERAMGAELSHHLGYPPGDAKPEEASNHRK